MEQEITVSEAIKVASKAIKEDPGYRIAWQANIAMAFQDEFSRNENLRNIIHEISNKAADSFIDNLTRDKQEG